MATSSPWRVLTVVGVLRSRTFSLSKVMLRHDGGWVKRAGWGEQRGWGERWVRRRGAAGGEVRSAAATAGGTRGPPLLHAGPPANSSGAALQPPPSQPAPRPAPRSPEDVDGVGAAGDVAGGQIHAVGHQPLLQRVRHAGGRGRQAKEGRKRQRVRRGGEHGRETRTGWRVPGQPAAPASKRAASCGGSPAQQSAPCSHAMHT